MITPSTYLRIVRAGAWYDLCISWPYATPLTLAVMWSLIGSVQIGMGLGAPPALDVHATLFANFFGTVVTLWSLVRLFRTEAAFGRYDAVARFVFASWMVVALINGATPLLYGFLAVEIAFGVAQALPVRTRRDSPEGGRAI